MNKKDTLKILKDVNSEITYSNDDDEIITKGAVMKESNKKIDNDKIIEILFEIKKDIVEIRADIDLIKSLPTNKRELKLIGKSV